MYDLKIDQKRAEEMFGRSNSFFFLLTTIILDGHDIEFGHVRYRGKQKIKTLSSAGGGWKLFKGKINVIVKKNKSNFAIFNNKKVWSKNQYNKAEDLFKLFIENVKYTQT